MGKTQYGRDASACESAFHLETIKWVSVVRHKLGGNFTNDLFGYFDSKDAADAHSAEVVRALNDPALLKHCYSTAYKEAMARRSEVLARHESLGRVSDGSVHKRKVGKYEGMLQFNGKLVCTLTHAESHGAETELASLRSTLLRGGSLEDHRLQYKAERVRHSHAEGTVARKEMVVLLEEERKGTNGDTRVCLTIDGHVPVRETWDGKRWNRLCSTPECMSQRQGANTKSEKCKECGGGLRCGGPNGEGCPFNTPIDTSKNRCDNMCVCCFVEENMNTTDPITRKRVRELGTLHRAKELAVREVLEKAFPHLRWTFDRDFAGNSSRGAFVAGAQAGASAGAPAETSRKAGKAKAADSPSQSARRVRPDAWTASAQRCVFVEVDEHSHATYACRAEREREAELVRRLPAGVEPCLIRFNPDAYSRYRPAGDGGDGGSSGSGGESVRVRSPFSFSTKKARVVVSNASEWKARTEELVQAVSSLLVPRGESGHVSLPAPALDAFKPLPPPEDLSHDARCMFVQELFYGDVAGVDGPLRHE